MKLSFEIINTHIGPETMRSMTTSAVNNLAEKEHRRKWRALPDHLLLQIPLKKTEFKVNKIPHYGRQRTIRESCSFFYRRRPNLETPFSIRPISKKSSIRSNFHKEVFLMKNIFHIGWSKTQINYLKITWKYCRQNWDIYI